MVIPRRPTIGDYQRDLERHAQPARLTLPLGPAPGLGARRGDAGDRHAEGLGESVQGARVRPVDPASPEILERPASHPRGLGDRSHAGPTTGGQEQVIEGFGGSSGGHAPGLVAGSAESGKIPLAFLPIPADTPSVKQEPPAGAHNDQEARADRGSQTRKDPTMPNPTLSLPLDASAIAEASNGWVTPAEVQRVLDRLPEIRWQDAVDADGAEIVLATIEMAQVLPLGRPVIGDLTSPAARDEAALEAITEAHAEALGAPIGYQQDGADMLILVTEQDMEPWDHGSAAQDAEEGIRWDI